MLSYNALLGVSLIGVDDCFKCMLRVFDEWQERAALAAS